MNSFDLAVRNAASGGRVLALVPIVDGRSFIDLVREFEAAHGFDSAGAYDGIIPAHFRFGPLDRYYLGLEDGWGLGVAAVLGCQCGEVGCWPGCVAIHASATTVTCSDFTQPHRADRDYSGLGPFEFGRQSYEAAVRAAMLFSRLACSDPGKGPTIHVDITFTTRDDGQIDAHLGDPWTVFDHALGDAISSLPPRGATGRGPSTYWIDVADSGARRAAAADDTRPFTWGNVTYLRIEGGEVVAAYDFDPDEADAESMPLDDFLGLLAEWRTRVLAAGTHSTVELPGNNRRNPIPRRRGQDSL